mgnify:CR=1 FL=1
MEWHNADANELRSMIKDHLLPRLDSLENEVQMLRTICWPVCQALREDSQLSDMRNKSIFMHNLHEVDVKKLLNSKAKFLQKNKPSEPNCVKEELSRIVSTLQKPPHGVGYHSHP